MGTGHFPSWLAGILLFPILASCGGGDLTLPRDGEVLQLVAISGDEQSGTTGSRLTEPLVVEARGRGGVPVEGAGIMFSFDGAVEDGELEPGTVVTDRTGRAAAAVRLGSNSGTQTVDARPDQAATDLLVRFRLTALQPDDNDDDPEGGGGGGGGGGGAGGDDDGDDDGSADGGGGGGGGDDDDHDQDRGHGKGGKGKGKGHSD